MAITSVSTWRRPSRIDRPIMVDTSTAAALTAAARAGRVGVAEAGVERAAVAVAVLIAHRPR
jgi:hypothetical protein